MTDLDLTKVIKSVTDLWDEPLDDVHDLPQIVNAILAAGYSRTVGTGAGGRATVQDTDTAWVTRSTDCPEAPAQAHCAGLNLTKLREIAEAATDGPWESSVVKVAPDADDALRGMGVIRSGVGIVFMSANGPEILVSDADHIATFDPPTVLALIDEVERLQSDLTNQPLRDRIDI